MAVVVVVLPLLLDVVEVVRALVCELSDWLLPTCTAER